MFYIKAGICDSDLHYSMRLMQYINQSGFGIRVSVFSSESALREYMNDNSLDILLTDVRDKDFGVQTLILTENREAKDIFKYQSADIICNIIQKAGAKCKNIYAGGFRLLGVYSPTDIKAKTILALSLCRHIKDSLYINLEDYLSIEASEDEIKAGEQFTYFLATKSQDMMSFVRDLCFGEEVKRLFTTKSYMDRQLGSGFMAWLRDTLQESGCSDLVVIDLGQMAYAGCDITCFDLLLVPYVSDDIGNRCIRHMKEALKEYEVENVRYIELDREKTDEQYFDDLLEEILI